MKEEDRNDVGTALFDELKMFTGRCVIEIFNQCPSDWGAEIIEIGAKFFFQDADGNAAGDEWTVKNTRILGPNGSDSVSSSDPGKCSAQVLVVCKVRLDRKDYVFQERHSTDKTHCLLYCPMAIAPKVEIGMFDPDGAPFVMRSIASGSAR